MPCSQIMEQDPINFSPLLAHMRLSFAGKRQLRDPVRETALLPGFMVFPGCLATMAWLSAAFTGRSCVFTLQQVLVASPSQSFLPCAPSLLTKVLPDCQSQPEIQPHQFQPVDCGAALSQVNTMSISAINVCIHLVFNDI